MEPCVTLDVNQLFDQLYLHTACEAHKTHCSSPGDNEFNSLAVRLAGVSCNRELELHCSQRANTIEEEKGCLSGLCPGFYVWLQNPHLLAAGRMTALAQGEMVSQCWL